MDKYQPHSKLYRATTVEPLADQDFGFPNTMPTTPAELEANREADRKGVDMLAYVIVFGTVVMALIALGVHFYFRGQA